MNILRQNSYTGIIALGLTFVIIAGGIDLSVGSMTALVGAVVIFSLNALAGWGCSPALAITGAILTGVIAGAVCGVLNALLVTFGKIVPFIATLGTMSIFRSLTLYITQAGEVKSVVDTYSHFGMGRFLEVPTPVWVFALLAIVFSVILHAMPFGRYALSVGASERVSRYAAIPVSVIRFMTYVICGATVGITAVLLSSRLNSVSPTTTGLYYELDAIAAVVIGGTSMSGGKGTIWGTVVGVLILGIVNNMLNMWGVSPFLQGTVKGAVILAAVLIQRPRD
jgi:ribose transport system permease protein